MIGQSSTTLGPSNITFGIPFSQCSSLGKKNKLKVDLSH